jgi:hypothetical protein
MAARVTRPTDENAYPNPLVDLLLLGVTERTVMAVGGWSSTG